MATLPERLQAAAEAHPDRLALVAGECDFSYGQLLAAAEGLADVLKQRGLHRIGLCGDNAPAWVVADLACLLAGVVCVPVPVFFSEAQTEHLVTTAGLQALLWSDEAPGREPLGQGVWINRLPDDPVRAPLPPDTAKITFTSGSTGTPRGVCLSQAQLLATVDALRERLTPVGPAQHLCILPLATLLENIAGVYLPLLMGATVRVEPLVTVGLTGSCGVDPRGLIGALNRWQPESLILVPELARLLVQAADAGLLKTEHYRFLAVGGGKVAPDLLSRGRALGLPLYEGYGLSECGSVVALNTPGDDRIGSGGRPLDHVKVRVDERRHILVRGNTHLGYLGDTGSGEAPDEWLDTGDLGQLTSDGFLQVDGRSKNLLITSFGRNISPEWLEAGLVQALGARQAVVFGDGEPRLSALVHLPPGQPAGKLEPVLHQLNQSLPDYARLGVVYCLEHPLSIAAGYLTANGRPVRNRIQSDLPVLMAGSLPVYPESREEASMEFFAQLQAETAEARAHVTQAPVIQAVQQGQVSLESYTWFLTQAFHHVKHTVPLMMACGGRLPEQLEGVRKALVEYIEEEYGHHEWILDDLQVCGEDREERRTSKPDLSIELMVAYLYHQIDRGNPAAFFGMVQVLEGTSIELATPLARQIQAHLGLPDKAFSYLYSHGELDQDHFKFFQDLMNGITDPGDQQAIIDSARVVYRLYGDMLHRIPLQPMPATDKTSRESDHATA
ncbi:AMP-binding protein [Marinobacter sp.]|uniref:AMP-binding protein n=1 Tax=Marinobacter sp. TaxID=50741 RepID=UPI00356801F1